jgi:1-deoxy-D-xylulose-5-phosphate synthase
VSTGPLAQMCLEVADRLADQGIAVTVVDPRWVSPAPPAVAEFARGHAFVATVEDNGRAGGIGNGVAELLRDRDVETPVKTFALPQEYLPHGKREQVLADAGLTAQDLAREIVEMVAKRAPALETQPTE